MSLNRTIRPLACALAAVAALASAGAQATALPAVQRQGLVAYLSGGIGRDEARAIERTAAQWPVELEFAAREQNAKDSAFLANVTVQILDAQHQPVLQTVSDGPFVLARLQPGHYEVQATFDGRTLTRTLRVGGTGTAREVFVWPHGAERADS